MPLPEVSAWWPERSIEPPQNSYPFLRESLPVLQSAQPGLRVSCYPASVPGSASRSLALKADSPLLESQPVKLQVLKSQLARSAQCRR